MKIDLTLFFQMGNFIVTYLIVSKFFLKPIFDLIKKEEHEKNQLTLTISQESEKLAAKKEFKKLRLAEFRQKFSSLKTDVLNFAYKKKIYNLERPEKLSKESFSTKVTDILQAIKSKVIH